MISTRCLRKSKGFEIAVHVLGLIPSSEKAMGEMRSVGCRPVSRDSTATDLGVWLRWAWPHLHTELWIIYGRSSGTNIMHLLFLLVNRVKGTTTTTLNFNVA